MITLIESREFLRLAVSLFNGGSFVSVQWSGVAKSVWRPEASISSTSRDLIT